MSKPLLSIIVPVYKTEKFLNRCIDSILAQSIKDYEVILVDDGSPDESPIICDYYVEKDSRIKVIHKQNQGLGMARNTGIRLVSGKYLTFLDSDDFVENDYYENLLTFAEDNDLDLCVAGYYIADTERKQKKVNTVEQDLIGKILINQIQISELSAKVICPNFEGKDFFSASVCFSIFNSDILINNNLFFDSERSFISEDLKFTMCLFHYCQKVGVSEKGGYHYCYNEESLSRGYNPHRFELLKKTVQQLEELCVELKLDGYIERIALYFWINFEKCLNQEVRYSKEKQHVRISNIKKISEDKMTQHQLTILINKNGLNGLQKILCMLIYNKCYLLIDFLLTLYNFFKHRWHIKIKNKKVL